MLLPENNAKGSLYLYDELGNFVNQQTFVANIGENILDLELKNSTGNSLSNGRYYYFIKMNTKFYIEDVSGIIVITK